MVFSRKRQGLFAAVLLFMTTLVGVQVSPTGAVDLPGARIFVSSSSSGNVDGVSFTGGDILVHDSTADTWAMFFDASANGLGSANIDGFHIQDATPGTTVIDMSFTGVVTVPAVGSVDDSDVVRWTEDTTSFVVVIDGSDVGLTSGGEDIDALSAIGSNYAVSTLGTGSVPAVGGGSLTTPDEDLVELDGTFGQPTTGEFTPLLDSSDVGLTGDLVSAWIDPGTNEIFGSVLNGFNIGGLTGDGDDIFVFTGTTGDPSSGTFALFWDGDMNRFGGEQIDGLFIEPGTPPPPGVADLSLTATADVSAAIAGDTVTYTVTVTNNGPDAAMNVVVTNTIPAGLSFASTSGCALDPNGLPCSLGDLSAGGTSSFFIATTVDPGTLGTVNSTVEATSSTSDPTPVDNSATASILVSGPPVAVDDGPVSSSAPGDDFHTDVETLSVLDAPGLLANDELGSPNGTIVSYGGGDLGSSVTEFPTSNDYGFGDGGYINLQADGRIEFLPPAGFVGPFSFQYRLENEGGFSDATVTIYVGPRPVVMGGDLIYLSTAGGGTVDDIIFEDEDVLVYDRGSDTWAMFIDGSDLGLGSADIDGFAIRADGSILMSLTAPRTIPGAGPTDDSDIVLFTPTVTGPTTAGTFSLFVDGSDLLLAAGGEDIDSVTEYGEGDIAISTFGAFNVGGGVAGVDEDLIALGLTGTGPVTTGTPSILFDGSDVDFQAEDISGASIDPDTNVFYLANLGNFNIPGLTGDGDDVIAYSGSPGPDTSGSFSTFFAGEDARFDNNQINALHVVQGDGGPPNTPPRILNETVAFDTPEHFPFLLVEVEFEDNEDDFDDLNVTLGGPDAGAFFVDGDNLIMLPVHDFENPTDADGNGTYEVDVTVTDAGGLADTETFLFTVTDVEPDPLRFLAGINESEAASLDDAVILEPGDPFELVFVFEEQYEEEILWLDIMVNGESVGDDLFVPCDEFGGEIQGTVACGLIGTAADAPEGVELEITATVQFLDLQGADPEFLALLQTTFTDSVWYRTNEAPTIDTDGPFGVAENQTAVADLETTDDSDSEGSGLTYSFHLGQDAGLFDLDSATGVLTFKEAPNFEDPQDADGDNSYEVQVRVTDSDGLSDDKAFTITVTNVVEQATIGDFVWNDINQNGIQDDGEPGIEGATVFLEDAATNVEITAMTDINGFYSFTVDPGDYLLCPCGTLPAGSGFTSPNQGGDPTKDSDFNQTGPQLAITLTDDEVNNDLDAGIIIFETNEAPVITTPGPFDVPENEVGSVDINSSEDPDVTYTISLEDSSLFNIDAATGVISFKVAPDHEDPDDEGEQNTYEFRVTATDAGGLSGFADIVINVTNVVEQATIGDFVWNDLNENGLQDDGEPGRSGVTVNLIDPVEDAVIDTDTTVAGGLYSFTVDPGDYIIEFVVPVDTAFTVPFADPNPNIDSDAAVATGRSDTITVGDDEENNSVDAGLIDIANQPPNIN